MSNFTVINGEEAKCEYLKDILELDKQVYPEKYWTNIEYITKWFLKNPNIITLLYDDKQLAGYFCYLPVKDKSYMEIRKGEVFQDLTIPVENIREYEKGNIYNLYLFSIVINPKYHGTDALKYLLKGFYDTTVNLREKGINFNNLLGDIVSSKGDKLANTLGFSKVHDSAYNSVIYENTYENFISKYEEKF